MRSNTLYLTRDTKKDLLQAYGIVKDRGVARGANISMIEINGATLEYFEQGEGENIIFVHGSNSDYRTWQNQFDEFANLFRAVVYSRRYHYPNEPIAEGVDYSMSEHVDDLRAFIQAISNEPVHLVGHSYGAFLGLLLAMRQPEMIRSLVLEEPPIVTLFISIPPKPQELLKLLLTRPRTAIAIMQFAMKGLIPATRAAEHGDMETAFRIFSRTVLGAETFDNLSEERLEQGRINNIKAEYLGSGFLPVDAEDVRQVRIPTLLINGANSIALFHRLLERLDELLPDSQHIVISAASHISHEDNPIDYNEAVSSFIKSH